MVSPSPTGLELAPQCRLASDSPLVGLNLPRAGLAGVHRCSDPPTCATGHFSCSHTQTLVLCALFIGVGLPWRAKQAFLPPPLTSNPAASL